jgi:hypothetical protein
MPSVTVFTRGSISLAVSGALLSATSVLSADISPPAGLDWISNLGVTVVNVDAFPDHVLVVAPCVSARNYCVLQTGDVVQGQTLHAIRRKDMTLNEGDIEKPKVGTDFFEKDPRVLRPGFNIDPGTFTTAVAHTGVRAARYFVKVEKIGDEGVEARFVRAEFQCRNGAKVEADWGPSQAEPPVASCPVQDDDGRLVAADAGIARATEPLPSRPPPTGSRLIWLGAVAVCLGLVGFGALLRDKKS